MSELTRCNFCTLQSIKSRAKAKDSHVVVKPGSFGTDVFVVPRNVDFAKLPRGDDDERTGQTKYRVASLLEVTSRCCC